MKRLNWAGKSSEGVYDLACYKYMRYMYILVRRFTSFLAVLARTFGSAQLIEVSLVEAASKPAFKHSELVRQSFGRLLEAYLGGGGGKRGETKGGQK